MNKYRIRYSIFVNGEEYPREATVTALSQFNAEQQLEVELNKFPENDYQIFETTQI